jgi:nucleotide-binding universal stress UspA family protein
VERIVVGVDGSRGARNALSWAHGLAAAHGAELVAMTGFVPTESELKPARYEVLLSAAQADLDRWVEAVPTGDVAVRTVVEPGDPRPAILTVAEREHADLVVVGRVGASAGPGLLHLGSLAEWLAHRSDVPVAVVGGAVNLDVRSALVGVDGSAGSRTAVRWVADLAQGADLRVVAATVVDPHVEWIPPGSTKEWRPEVEQSIRTDFAAELSDAGVDCTALALCSTNAAEALLQAAQEERTDIVVVGMRGTGGFTQLRIGGVALKVLHQADRPVVLIPTGAGQA